MEGGQAVPINELRSMTTFAKAAELGSLRQAAVAQGMTPQAASQALAQLEKHLGVRLFHRTTRHLALTDEGRQFLEAAQPALAALQRALQTARHAKDEIAGPLRIVGPRSTFLPVLWPVLEEFCRIHPDVQPEVQMDDRIGNWVEDRVDVGFRIGQSPAEGVIARRLFPLQLIICASPSYLAHHGAPNTLNDLAAHRCSVFRLPNTGKVMPWYVQVGNDVVSYDVAPALCTNEEELETQAVLAGQVMGLLTGVTAAAHIRAGRLVPILAQHMSGRSSVFVYYGSRASQPARSRAFIDHAMRRLTDNTTFVLTPKELAAAEAKGRKAMPRSTARKRATGAKVMGVVAASCLVAALALPPSAAARDWTPVGPSAGAVRSLAHDAAGGALYAGTYSGGIFKSTDAGASWSAVAPALRGETIGALALHPAAPRTIYAGTFNEGVWRSTDAGATWKRVLFGGKDMPNRHAAVNALAIDPADARIVYAATDTGFNAGVWRSADAGNTWTSSTAGLPPNFRLTALAIDPKVTSTLYVATNTDGVYRSHDAGRTWTATGAGVSKEIVRTLAVDPVATSTVYAGTSNAGVFKSNDGGATWLAAPEGAGKKAQVYALAVDPGNPSIVWAGIVNGLLRSADGGRTWIDTMPELEYATVRAVALDPARGVTFAGTTRDGVRRSGDQGRTWSGPGTGFHAHDVTGIAVDASPQPTVWLSTGAGIWRSTDGGAKWALKSDGLASRESPCVTRDAALRMLYACSGDGVFRSSDGGETWSRQQSGLSLSMDSIGIALDPSTPRTVYARDATGVYRSRDAGATWQRSGTDLEASGSINGLFALAATAGAPGAVFASVYRHFWKSTDGGATFAKSGSGLPLARVQTVAAEASGTTIWLGTEGEGVWRSSDGGVTWVASRAGMGAANVQALLVDPARPGTLYAAAWSKGVYRSNDGGRTWTLVGGAPPHPDVIALALDPATPGHLLVGMPGGGLWRLDTRAR